MADHDHLVRVGNRNVPAIDPATGKIAVSFIPDPVTRQGAIIGRPLQTAVSPYMAPVELVATGAWQDTGCHIELPQELRSAKHPVLLQVVVPVWCDAEVTPSFKLVRTTSAVRTDLLLPGRDLLFAVDVPASHCVYAYGVHRDQPRAQAPARYELWARAPGSITLRLGGHGAITLQATEIGE